MKEVTDAEQLRDAGAGERALERATVLKRRAMRGGATTVVEKDGWTYTLYPKAKTVEPMNKVTPAEQLRNNLETALNDVFNTFDSEKFAITLIVSPINNEGYAHARPSIVANTDYSDLCLALLERSVEALKEQMNRDCAGSA